MTSREEILADFQACTGIEDVEMAITQLEDAGWVLLDAVNKAMPPAPAPPVPPPVVEPLNTAFLGASSDTPIDVDSDSGTPPQSMIPLRPPPPPIPLRTDSSQGLAGSNNSSGSSSPFGMFPLGGGMSVADDFYRGVAGPSNLSNTRTRMLDFYVQHNDRTFHLKVPDNEDVKTLKTLIQAETNCPPCQQTLRGLNGNSGLLVSNRRRLSELSLPKENFLHLITPNALMDTDNPESKPAEPGDFKLHIHCLPQVKTYDLNFRPTHSVLNVKLDVASLTNIPVSRQEWTGWPEAINDDLSLAQIGIPQDHKLTLDRKPGPSDMPILDNSMASSSTSTTQRQSTSNHSGLGESEDDFEDAMSEPAHMEDDDDDIFDPANLGSASSKRLQPLIPDDYGDNVMASLKFSEEFTARYGTPHPGFFPGTLDDAIKESCMQPPKQRKMLAIYLHHDSSVLTNVFCTQALCAESVVAFLNENFVTFGWDLTFSSNKKRALDMITNHFGSVTAATVRNLDIERLPLLALVYKLRGTTEIFQIIHGNVTLDELMSQLLQAHDTYVAQLAVEIREEEERQARDAVKREQDLAFEMAQHADREKELVKQREEEDRLEEERIQEAIRRSEEEARLKEEAEKERVRREVAKTVPDEPPLDAKHTKIRFRIPGDNSNLERRFLPSDSLQTLLDYLTSKGFNSDDFKVLSSWPRRDLTTLERTSTLEELKLCPQETLTLEER